MRINWTCWRNGHDWLCVGQTGPWMRGGTYFYICRRCLKKISSKPTI